MVIERGLVTENQVLIQIAPDRDPAVIALLEQVNGLLKYAESRTVATAEDVKLATEDLSLISLVKKTIEAEIKRYTDPPKQFLKEMNLTFKTLTDPLDQANSITRQKILAYRTEQERRRREAEEINRQKEELAKREAALNHGEITVDTTPVVVPDAQPKMVRTEVGNAGIVHNRKYRINDFAKLPDIYKLENSVLLNKVTKAGIPEILGVEFYFEDSLRITTK